MKIQETNRIMGKIKVLRACSGCYILVSKAWGIRGNVCLLKSFLVQFSSMDIFIYVSIWNKDRLLELNINSSRYISNVMSSTKNSKFILQWFFWLGALCSRFCVYFKLCHLTLISILFSIYYLRVEIISCFSFLIVYM